MVLIDILDSVWQDHAVCAGMDQAIFFPERGESHLLAYRICAKCPVKLPCLDYALEHRERFGIWGGVSERGRRRMRRERRAA